MRICKKVLIVVLAISLFVSNDLLGQDSTARNTITKRAFYKSLILPTTLIGMGLIIKGSDIEHNFNSVIRSNKDEDLLYVQTHIEDYLQYIPIVAAYGLNLAGVKGENNIGNRTALLIKSELLMAAIVHPLKRFSSVTRPDGSTENSFPSGHTAQAFVAATFLHKEFGKKSIWYSVGAYTCATAVGSMRMLNNRHWLSDVLVGAGIGIASTNLIYYTHRYKWSKKTGKTVVMPTYGNGPGLYFCYNFR
ncbi:MAG: phosphatase PAP2 family protein [Bacteroidia bacterium]|nr:phosphatase PAP2 family protein [Bacteroidia bacterium]